MEAENLEYIYSVKCIFNAHVDDVRAIKPTYIPHGGILTGSRDMTAKIWEPEGKLFKECNTFKGATAFIASLCVLPPSTQYPKGLILAGSNDCSIYGFSPDFSKPILRLLGHSGTVCTLSYGKDDFIISGSWDKTARVWNGQQCVLTLEGHHEAIWATDVFPMQNSILTGSADHTIRLWRQGVCEKIFTGHEDCVRGLAIMSDEKFLSCSNDSSVRLWLISGECLQVFKSHTDYIYSISLLSNTMEFATCGEDQNIKIWRNGVCIQTIVLSSKSLWNVAYLSNGDLAVGTNDGKVYVFEKVPRDHFESILEVHDEVGEPRDTLERSRNGSSDQMVLDTTESVYKDELLVIYLTQNNSIMYVCQYDNVSGTKIQKKALDFQFINKTFYKKSNEESAANNASPTKKTDYAFDVEVENNIYKLFFNERENPWDVAIKFVGEHNLPIEHISQIVNFIVKNTSTSFKNPFYPVVENYLFYLNANTDGLRAKLLQFCDLMPKEKQLSPSEVDELMQLAHFPDVVSTEQMSSLDKVISWTDEFLFPVLDLLRLGVQCKGLRSKISSNKFMNYLLHIFMNTDKSVNQVLVEKILCNMFGLDETEEVLTSYQEKIFEAVKEKLSTGAQSIQKAASTLFLNFAIASYNGFRLSTDRYCLATVDVLTHVRDTEAIYRMLAAVCTVCARNASAVTYFRSVNLKEFILQLKGNSSKIDEVVQVLYSNF